MPNYEIVGSHFRPPAKGILAGISPGTLLHLRAEPSNQFDINAIQVLLKPENILKEDTENLNSELSGFGKDMSDLLIQESWHLGYIRKEIAKVLRESGIILTNEEYKAEFVINLAGKPMVSFNEI